MIYSMFPPCYTYKDYAQWQENWELICGYPFQIPSPIVKHCYTKDKLLYQAIFQLEKFGSTNTHIFTLLDWIVDNQTVVRPDLMIVCGELKTDYLEFPPVLIAEVISQSSIQKDRNIKFELYRENGVKYYLMIDYTKETVEVFQLIDNIYRSVEINEFILTNECTVEFDFSTIFKN